MFTASSAAVTTPSAVARLLLFICCGQLMVTTVNTDEAMELEEKQIRQDRSIDGDNSVMESECQKFEGEIFNDRCYLFSEVGDLKNYDEAIAACIAKQGELAMFPDFPGSGIHLVDHRDTGDPRYWVGGRNKDTEGGWQWENGVPIEWPYKHYPWGHDEPNGLDHEKCLDILTTGDHHGYNDEQCGNKHQYICELGCSFGGTVYPPGSFIHEACVQLQCNGATGRFDIIGYDNHCPTCRVWGDPHITTYDQSTSFYSYQRCGNHSITQIGKSETPSHAVYGYFVSCTDYSSSLACLDSITLKNDNQTFITVGYPDNKFKIEVNGKDFKPEAITSSPSIVKVDDTEYPVLAWTTAYNCVILQGSAGLMVKFCGRWGSNNANEMFVWATPDIHKGLNGLCGTPNGNINDDLTTKDGSQTWNMTSNPPVTFGLSWIADSKFPGQSCGNSRMEIENKCESNTSLSAIFRSKCEDTVLNGIFTADANQSQILIDACVYDLCGAIDPDKGIEAVNASMPVHAYIRDNTVGHCEHKRTHKCKTHNGICILKTETCDGTIIDRGCHGRKCECCAPSGCKQSPKCLNKQGKCMLLKDAMNCEGIVNSQLCSGNKCACCYPKAPKTCKISEKCSKVNGKCISKENFENCDGKLKKIWCNGRKCGCCYQ